MMARKDRTGIGALLRKAMEDREKEAEYNASEMMRSLRSSEKQDSARHSANDSDSDSANDGANDNANDSVIHSAIDNAIDSAQALSITPSIALKPENEHYREHYGEHYRKHSDDHSDGVGDTHSAHDSAKYSAKNSGVEKASHPSTEASNFIQPKLPGVRTDNEKKLHQYLSKRTSMITSYSRISKDLRIPTATVRAIVSRWEKLGYLSRERYYDGPIRGIHIQAFFPDETKHYDEHYREHYDEHSDSQCDEHYDEHSEKRYHERYRYRSEKPSIDRQIEEDKKNLSILDRLRNLTVKDIEFFYPGLHMIGFGPHQIEQILDKLSLVGKSPDYLLQSLEYANWDIENGGIKDKDGNLVANPLNYVFVTLARNGIYRKPAGFKTLEEQAAEDAESIARQREDARKRKLDAEFQAWRTELTKELEESILTKVPGFDTAPGRESRIRQYWAKHVLQDQEK